MKKFTPIKAIRAKCLNCSESKKHVKECPFRDCAVYLYRMGCKPTASEIEDIKGEFGKSSIRTPIKAIRAECLDCMRGQHSEVKKCPSKQCPSWPYRMGKRPNDSDDLEEGNEQKDPS